MLRGFRPDSDDLGRDMILAESLEALDPARRDPNYWMRFRGAVLSAAGRELARRRLIQELTVEDVLTSWARTIVRFEALKTRRRVARDRLTLSEETIVMLAEQAAGSPDELLDRERSALRHCLQQFSDEHRKLLLAPYLSSGGVREMAERSGRTANSLYKLLGRLRAV